MSEADARAARNRLKAATAKGDVHLHWQEANKWRVVGVSRGIGRPIILCGTPACMPLHEGDTPD
jgi:hypothetical protein